MNVRSSSIGSTGGVAVLVANHERRDRGSMKRSRPSPSAAPITRAEQGDDTNNVASDRACRKFATPSMISVVLAALLSLLATAAAVSPTSTAAASRAHNQHLPLRSAGGTGSPTDVVDLLHDIDTTTTATTTLEAVGVAMTSPEARRENRKRNLEYVEPIAIRQVRAFDVSLSPVTRNLDFAAISQLNVVMGEMVIANLDLAPNTEIEFSTVLLAQDVTTVNPGKVPVLTIRVLKTAYITFPEDEEDRIPTDESFDEAVESLFADVVQKQELVYKLRETKNSAFASLWEVEFAGFMTDEPTSSPTDQPSHRPSAPPTSTPSFSPTMHPTPRPTDEPTKLPSPSPSSMPSLKPTPLPTVSPTARPSRRPSLSPTASPTHSPTSSPTFDFASLTVEGNVFDISLTPMATPLDFFSTTHLNNALSEMVRRNLVLDFKAKVEFTTVLLYQSIQIVEASGNKKQGDQSQEQPQLRWQYDNTRRLEGNRSLTHKTTTTSTSSEVVPYAKTLIVRVQLTAHVSVPTIGGGKYDTHFIPDMDDIDNAVSAVFADLAQRRELLERLQNSYDQFKSLTNVGFVEFIYPPTPSPSAMPSVTHSESPSNVPSSAPSLGPAVVDVRGNVIEISLAPVTQLLDFDSIDTLFAALDGLVGNNLIAIVPELDKGSVSFSTDLISQYVEKDTRTLKVRVSRVAHFSVKAKSPGIPIDSAVVPTGGGIDLATQIVFTDISQRASLIESLRSSSLNEDIGDGDVLNLLTDASGDTNVFQSLREITFEQFVYPPTPEPTPEPSMRPSASPSSLPSDMPSKTPSVPPTKAPTLAPTTHAPSMRPTTGHPTTSPTMHPTSNPTEAPTFLPSASPTTAAPTPKASEAPSRVPSIPPTAKPTYLPVILDVPLSDFTLLFSPIDLYLAQGVRDELNDILDQMIIDNLIVSKELGPAKIEFSTTVLGQLTSEDEEEGSKQKGGKRRRRRIQQRKPDPYLAVAFRKVAHITVPTLDIFGNINEDAVPDSASFDLAVLTIFTDLSEKERFVLSLIDSIAPFSDLRNVILKDSVSSRIMPSPAISSRSRGGSGNEVSSNPSNQIVPGVSNSMFYGIVATASIIICAVALAAGKMILSNRNEEEDFAGFDIGGNTKKIQLGIERSKGNPARPRSGPSSGHHRSHSRPRGHPERRSRERLPNHHLKHHQHQSHRPPVSQEYNLQQMPQQYYQQQEAMNDPWGTAANYDRAMGMGMGTGHGMTMDDEGDTVSELEVGESVVANMMSMKEQDGGYGRQPVHSFAGAGGVHSHHHAPRRAAYSSGGDYDGWNTGGETTWDRVDAT